MVYERDRTIVLVGLMGVGKTSIGKRLAKQLGMFFIDIDEAIEEEIGHSISWIFQNVGESDFRKIEKTTISKILEGSPCVVATGGGAFINEETKKIIKEKSLSVWLKADLDILVERVSRRDTRPLLETGDKREIMEKLMNEREPIYKEADITIESGLEVHQDVVDNIIKVLNDKK